MTHLFLCQIGPVQPFIAAGRRTQDLYVGSRILSQLARAGLSSIKNAKNLRLIYPSPINDGLPNNVPHRFAFTCDKDPHEVGRVIKDAIHKCWQEEYVAKVKSGLGKWIQKGKQHDVFARQTENSDWIEFYWVAVDYKGDYQTSYTQANIALAQRKLLRHVPHIQEDGRKCTLTGAQSSLFPDNKKEADIVLAELRHQFHDDGILFRDNEYLGSLALIKRLADHKTIRCALGNIPIDVRSTTDIAGITEKDEKSGEYGYLAVLHMDGDGIGKLRFASEDDHSAFSNILAQFSENVGDTIKGHGGILVYSGGDDVLALLPLKTALRCSNHLQTDFSERLKYLNLTVTMSAGIAITPHDFPLDVALEMARQAEEKAKDTYRISDGDKKGAIFVTEAHGTGTIREAGGNWDVIPLVNDLITYFADDTLSGKLGYDILTIAHDMGGSVPAEAREAELGRIIRRRLSKKVTPNIEKEIIEGNIEKECLAKRIATLAEGRASWQDMAHWTILARFIAKPTKEVVGS